MFLKIKFLYYLGRKKIEAAKIELDKYKYKYGQNYKYYDLLFTYSYEIKDFQTAYDAFRKCIELRGVDTTFENWGISFFTENKIAEKNYQLAARNAMGIADLENLSPRSRVRILKLLEYIKKNI